MILTAEMSLLPEHRLFSPDQKRRDIAAALYHGVKQLPIISPHGHTDPAWFAQNKPFENVVDLLLLPDHYILRMLYSAGIGFERLGVPDRDGNRPEVDPREAWKLFAEQYHLFLGTPSRIWLDHVFYEIFDLDRPFEPNSADFFYDHINAALASNAFLPRAILDRFNIRFLATTEGATDDLRYHRELAGTGFEKRIVTTFRPDDVVDPDGPNFAANVAQLAVLTGIDTCSWDGYLEALRSRRAFFRRHGATATDHGHPTARTADLSREDCQRLFSLCLLGQNSAADAELFRAQMLTEMAAMSLEDGMVMQLHAGAQRNRNKSLFDRYGQDKGADIPGPTDFVGGLKPLLDRFGNEAGLTLILFTLDESTYARELAPLAGHFPCLRLGPPWWFHDSPEGMLRFRQRVTETAGFYNTVGFNDDTRAILSIPARHDVARRMDCRYLAELVADHRLSFQEAEKLAYDLTYRLVVDAYRLEPHVKGSS